MLYDVVVMGAGPGGYVAAIRAAQLGARTAIIEKNSIGGTCLNVGCIPTKALIKNADILHDIKSAKKRGIIVKDIELDYKKAVKNKDRTVKQLVKGVEGLLKANGVDVYMGTGTVHPNKTITVSLNTNEKSLIEFDKLIIATGSTPSLPPIDGVINEGVMTSNEMLSLDEVPGKIVVIGGGVIGCEFASIFAAYGSEVTIIEMTSGLVSTLDDTLSDYMGLIMENQGVRVKTECSVKKIIQSFDNKLDVMITQSDGKEDTITCDKVLISIGRRNNFEGLEELNLELEDGRFIKVDEFLETSIKDIYAIGDVASRKQLAHVASEMGCVAAENVMGARRKNEIDIVPSCIYTVPEIASVGLSEKEAKAKGINISVGLFPLSACGKAVATDDTEGIFKVVSDAETHQVLGAHLIGKSATEIIGECAAYIKMGATLEDVVNTIHAHPTISEAVAEAARDALNGKAIHMPPR